MSPDGLPFPPQLERFREETRSLRTEVTAKIVGYIVAALGLVAGLAWNDAIKALIEAYFPQQENTVKAKFVYALLISLVVVTVSIYVSRLAKKEDKEKEKKKLAKEKKLSSATKKNRK